MNKMSLVEAVAEKLGSNRKVAQQAVEAVFDTILGALSEGDKVAISNFGTFACVTRKAHPARNPQTGDVVMIAERVAPCFRASNNLKVHVGKTVKIPEGTPTTQKAPKGSLKPSTSRARVVRPPAKRRTAKKATTSK